MLVKTVPFRVEIPQPSSPTILGDSDSQELKGNLFGGNEASL